MIQFGGMAQTQRCTISNPKFTQSWILHLWDVFHLQSIILLHLFTYFVRSSHSISSDILNQDLAQKHSFKQWAQFTHCPSEVASKLHDFRTIIVAFKTLSSWYPCFLPQTIVGKINTCHIYIYISRYIYILVRIYHIYI